MRVLLFGGTGHVGAEICALAGDAGVDLVAPGHADLDLTDREAIAELIVSQPWDVVINGAVAAFGPVAYGIAVADGVSDVANIRVGSGGDVFDFGYFRFPEIGSLVEVLYLDPARLPAPETVIRPSA